jgi:FtsP/CotA-like multicopper oxidase with cupredoxin domain
MVPTLRSVRIAFDANNPGTWMLHCHNAWHLQAGMATTVKYAG